MICRIRTNCIDRTFEEPTQKVVFGQTKVTLGCFDWGAVGSGPDAEISPAKGPPARQRSSKVSKSGKATGLLPPPQIQMNLPDKFRRPTDFKT